MMTQHTNGNRPWHIEQHGINTIPELEKKGHPQDLFWVWFAANIGILGVLYGGIIVSYHLSFLQSILTAAIGSLSFIIVGILSIAGRDGSAPMLTLSRAVFGTRGNLLPTIVSWVNLLGWESVTVITGTLSFEALLQTIFGVNASLYTSIASMVIFIGLVVLFGLLGQATLVIIQKIAAWLFGLLTFSVILLLLHGTHWNEVFTEPSGSWIRGFLPAVSMIIAGNGISWGNAAADYSRYQPHTVPKRTILWVVTLGSSIPVFILMMVGVLLTSRAPELVTAANPIAAIGRLLPAWMAIPYLIAAIGGMLTQADLGLYSSGLNLLAMGVKVARHKTIVIDAFIMGLITVYVLFIHQNFMGPFESFLSLGGAGLAAWEATFIVDGWMIRRKTGYLPRISHSTQRKFGWTHEINGVALLCWGIGIMVGLLFTNSPLFNGPLAIGIFANSNLGVLFAFLSSGLLYGAMVYPHRNEQVQPRPRPIQRDPGNVGKP
ncbi:hypothetical protein D2Q93_11135 [Alicyclobacillaceae bacterium I2511]|jgi:purine-cytosine permease-like protein|nr:hypothetical protein D2Q93_11135 [Alicyclobacillaceae bacterium I2511]